MSIFRTRYRIVTDDYNGYAAQFRRWWMPFYVQCFFCNTSATVDRAREIIKRHAQRVIEVIDPAGETP